MWSLLRHNRLMQFSGFTFKNDATALDVLRWLSKDHHLCESTPYLFMSLLYRGGSKGVWGMHPPHEPFSTMLWINKVFLQFRISS